MKGNDNFLSRIAQQEKRIKVNILHNYAQLTN